MRARFAFTLILGLGFLSGAASALEGQALTVTVDRSGVYQPLTLSVDGLEPGASYVATGDDISVPMTATPIGVVAVVPPELASGRHTLTIEEPARQSDDSGVTIEKVDDAVLEVTVGGDLVTRFHYGQDLRKPYLWPVKGPRGAPITRDWPLGDRNVTRDHPHHTSFWTGYGNLNGADYWEFGERTGWQRVVELDFGSGLAAGWIKATIVWEDKDHKPVIAEERTFVFYTTPEDQRLFDLTVNFYTPYGEVKFGDTKEGGLAGLRMNDDLREQGGSGTITNSEGGVGAGQTWGKPAAWCDYSGALDGVGALGITVMDHPSSFRHPTHWHVRDYGLMGANAFGYSYFYDGEKNGDYLLPANQSMIFRYRMYIHAGDVHDANVAETYEAFANPPTGTIN